jgi:hypothetical protein
MYAVCLICIRQQDDNAKSILLLQMYVIFHMQETLTINVVKFSLATFERAIRED